MLQVSLQGFTRTQYINYTSHLTMQILCVCFTHNNNNENSLRRLIRYLYCSAGRTLETVGKKVSATLEMIWGKKFQRFWTPLNKAFKTLDTFQSKVLTTL